MRDQSVCSNMPAEDVQEHVIQWLSGDDSAFETVFLYYRPRLLRYAIRYLHHETAAEDLTTEVLVKVWQHRNSLTTAETFEGYLFTIARNLLIKAWQKKVDVLLALDAGEEIADTTGAHETVLYKELEQHYRESLAALPEQRRRIFLLHREQNLSYREIAQQLNISPKTVENQISSTLKQLRIQLSRHLSSLIV